MSLMDQKQKIYNFLNSQAHIVLGTVNKEGGPEGAWIGFGQTTDLEIIFGTDNTTRKYKNLSQNPKVAFTCGDRAATVQYQGIATLIEGEAAERLKQFYWQKVPSAKDYDQLPGQVYYKVTPKWIRYADYTKEPEEIFEIDL